MLVPIQTLCTRTFGHLIKLLRPYGEHPLQINALLAVTLIVLTTITSARAKSDVIQILALGDSLTAGYGLSQSEAFPTRLAAALREKGIATEIVNAGVSGDTTSGALQRLDWLLDRPFKLAIVELGANDALRAVSPELTRQNLETIVRKLKATGATVLLAGMKAPRNLGPDFAKEFDPIFPELAKSLDLQFYPFFLDGVAADPYLNQGDGMHPNAKGVAIIVERMLPFVMRALGKE